MNSAVSNIEAIWRATGVFRGTQLVFSDMGVHPTSWGYSAYDEITTKLVGRGIPREQIAAIGDADTDAKTQVLFEKVRNGTVRVLIGSTQKMGTGTNVQRRLVALHHLDAPWKPAEVEQREGRILRQGNENEEVAIYRYVTQGSFDSFMWQSLETKARFISQVMTGDCASRRAEDIGGQELSYAEVKAIASGNPAVLTLAEADAELQRLAVLRKNHSDEQFLARRNLRDLPETIERHDGRMKALTIDLATLTLHANDPVTVGERECRRDEVLAILGSRLESLPELVLQTRRFPLGVYRGLRFGIAIHPEQAPEIYLEGATLRHATLSREHHGPRAVLNAVERVASDTDARRLAVRSELVLAEGQLRDYQERLGKPFPHHAYQADLTELRDRLKLALSATTPSATTPSEPGTEPTATARELADLIRALKDKQTLDTPPQAARLGTRSPTAERPVTARIRERREESLSTVSISDGDPPPSTNQPEADLPIEGRFALNQEATSSA